MLLREGVSLIPEDRPWVKSTVTEQLPFGGTTETWTWMAAAAFHGIPLKGR